MGKVFLAHPGSNARPQFFSCQQDMTGQSDPFVEVRRNILFIVFFEKKNCQPSVPTLVSLVSGPVDFKVNH